MAARQDSGGFERRPVTWQQVTFFGGIVMALLTGAVTAAVEFTELKAEVRGMKATLAEVKAAVEAIAPRSVKAPSTIATRAP